MSTSDQHGIVLNYGDTLIRATDLKLLTDSKCSWLNDTLIGFYFEYLAKEVFPLKPDDDGSGFEKRLKFFSPQVTQCMKLYGDCQVFIDTSDGEITSFHGLFWPVNNSNDTEAYVSGSHWSLLVYSKEGNTFYHVDSSAGMNQYSANTLFTKLKVLFKPEPALKSFACQNQANGYDCGFHVLINAELIGEHVMKGDTILDSGTSTIIETATPAKAEAMRSTLAQLILKLKS